MTKPKLGKISRKLFSFFTASLMVLQIVVSAFTPTTVKAADPTTTPRDKKLYTDYNPGKSLSSYTGISREKYVAEASKKDKYYGLKYYETITDFDGTKTGVNCNRFLTMMLINAGGKIAPFSHQGDKKMVDYIYYDKGMNKNNTLPFLAASMGVPYTYTEQYSNGAPNKVIKFKKNEVPNISKVKWYEYQSAQDLIKDGKAKKGDWIFVMPSDTVLYELSKPGNVTTNFVKAHKDMHCGIYWGDEKNKDLALNIRGGVNVKIEDLNAFSMKGHNQKVKFYLIPFSDVPEEIGKGYVQIKKTVKGNQLSGDQTLEGVKYGVYDGSKAVDIITLNKNGEGHSSALLELNKKYTIKEVKSKPYLTHDDKTYTAIAKDNGMEQVNVQVNVEDTSIEGEVKVDKVIDAFSENKLSAKGTEFRLYNKEVKSGQTLEQLDATGIKPIATISYDPTNKDGNKFTKLPINKTYYIAEGKPALGLARNNTVAKVDLTPNGKTPDEQVNSVNRNVKFTDKELYFTGSFEYQKRDAQLVNEKDPILQGNANFKDMRLKLTFQAKDNGNYKDVRTWTVKMPESGKFNLDNTLRDLKVDGPSFYEKDGNIIWPAGRVKVEEVTPPTGYTKDGNDNSISYITLNPVFTEEPNVKVDLANDKPLTNKVKRGHFELAKFEGSADCENEEGIKLGLANAEFSIINSSEKLVVTQDGKKIQPGQEYMRFKTDEFGFFSTESLSKDGVLPLGTYTLHEVSTGRDDLAPIADTKFTLTNDKQIVKLIAEDKLISAPLKVVKKDKETGKTIPMANTSFRILNSDKLPVQMIIRYPSNKVLDVFTTDETGSVQLPSKLAKGKYYIEEVNAPEGYARDKNLIPFEINESKDWGHPVEVEFKNNPQKVQVSFKKLYESALKRDLTSKENEKVKQSLKQAKFEFIAKEDIVLNGDVKVKAGKVAGTYGLDDTLNGKTDPLYPGKYIVKETNIPEGILAPNKEVLTLDLKADHSKQDEEVLQFNTEIKNFVNGTIINKVDKENHDIKLANVEFEIWKDGSKDKEKAVTNENGEIVLQALESGKWNIKETKTIPGYILNTNTFSFNIDEKSHKVDCENILIENIKTKVNLRKVDNNDKDLADAWMTLLDKNGESIDPNKYLPKDKQVETIVFENQAALDKALEEEKQKALDADNELKKDTLDNIITQSTQNIKDEKAKEKIEQTFKKDINNKKVLEAVDLALKSGKENDYQVDLEELSKDPKYKNDKELLKAIEDVNECLASKYLNPNQSNETYGKGMCINPDSKDGIYNTGKCLNPNMKDGKENQKIEDRKIIVWKSSGKDMILEGLPIGHYVYAEIKAPQAKDKYQHYEIAPLKQITVQATTEIQEFKIVNNLLNLDKPCEPAPPEKPEKPNKPNKPDVPEKPEIKKGTFQEHHIYIIRDENGKEIGREEIDGDKLTGTNKDTYDTSKIDKDEYKLVKVTSKGGAKYDENGKKLTNNFVNGKDQSITYVYEKVKKSPKKGTFQEHHIYITKDKDGKEIGREVVDKDKLSGTAKDMYSTAKIDKDGYKLVKIDEKGNVKYDENGAKVINNFVEDKDQSITYVYEKIAEEPKSEEGTFQEHHVYIIKDKDGKVVDTKVVDGELSKGTDKDEYKTSMKEKDGYKFVKTDKPINDPTYNKDGSEAVGKYIAGKAQEITYIYEQVEEEPEKPLPPKDNEEGPGKELPKTSARKAFIKDNSLVFAISGIVLLAVAAFAGYKFYKKDITR